MDYQDKKYKNTQDVVQRVGKNAVPIQDNREHKTIQRKPNNTGLPDNLKSGIENLSGHSMDDVKVHYNSNKPAQLNAHAYAQGTNIHLASGQEKHLPHEAWHVAQQKQGRVKPTTSFNGAAINDNAGLEKEADVMGGKALQMKPKENKSRTVANSITQKKSSGRQGFGFVDIRSEAITQTKLQGFANNGQRTNITTDLKNPIQRVVINLQNNDEKTKNSTERLKSVKKEDQSQTIVPDQKEITPAKDVLSSISENEPIYIVAHGNGSNVGGLSSSVLAKKMMTEWALPKDYKGEIFVVSCRAGEKMQGLFSKQDSFGERLKDELIKLGLKNGRIKAPIGAAKVGAQEKDAPIEIRSEDPDKKELRRKYEDELETLNKANLKTEKLINELKEELIEKEKELEKHAKDSTGSGASSDDDDVFEFSEENCKSEIQIIKEGIIALDKELKEGMNEFSILFEKMTQETLLSIDGGIQMTEIVPKPSLFEKLKNKITK